MSPVIHTEVQQHGVLGGGQAVAPMRHSRAPEPGSGEAALLISEQLQARPVPSSGKAAART